MPWECKSCHGSISLDPDPRGCDDEPICWQCLYEHREALLAVCKMVMAYHTYNTYQGGGIDPPERVDFIDVLDAAQEAIELTKGEP